MKEVCVGKVDGGGQEVSRLAGVVGLALNIVEPSRGVATEKYWGGPTSQHHLELY